MKIAIDARLVFETIDGISRYVINLTKALGEIDDQNEYVIFHRPELSPSHPLFGVENPGFSFAPVDVPHMSLQQQFFVKRVIKKHGVQLYHYPHLDMPLYTGVPSVATIYGLAFLKGTNFSKMVALKKTYLHAMTRLTCVRANRIITISKATKNDLLKSMPIASEKIKVIYLAKDERFKTTDDKELLDRVKVKYNLPDNYIFFLGINRPHKNIPGLLNAFSIYREHGGDCMLVLGGKVYEKYDRDIQEQIKSIDTKRIVAIGYIQDEDLPAIYQMARLFVLPSFFEGFGLPIIEAMGCGCPVVTSNTSGMAELGEGKTVLFDPNSPEQIAKAMLDVTTNENERMEMSQLGLEFAARFCWRNTALETLEIYKQVFEENHSYRKHVTF